MIRDSVEAARRTSESEISPVSFRITLTFRSSSLKDSTAAAIASRDPATSALIIRFICVFVSLPKFSNGFFLPKFVWTTSDVTVESEVRITVSPTPGAFSKPKTSTGIETEASFTCLPSLSTNDRTLPFVEADVISWPTSNLPFLTKIVATGPRNLSKADSITTPSNFWPTSSFNSDISATRLIISSKSSTPWPVLAEMGTVTTSPP